MLEKQKKYDIMPIGGWKMKKFVVTLLLFLFMAPMVASAKDLSEYHSLNLDDALKDEEIAKVYSNYVETGDQAIIYLFRGKGCSFCRSFLTFLNNITDEYGKYFRVVSYETWNDVDNYALLQTVSSYMGNLAGGVPYIVIGDKAFPGYISDWDQDIKDAIMKVYNTPLNERYDVLANIEKEGYVYTPETNPSDGDTTGDSSSGSNSNYSQEDSSNGASNVIWTLAFVAIGTAAVIAYNWKQYNKLDVELDEIKSLCKKQKNGKE